MGVGNSAMTCEGKKLLAIEAIFLLWGIGSSVKVGGHISPLGHRKLGKSRGPYFSSGA